MAWNFRVYANTYANRHAQFHIFYLLNVYNLSLLYYLLFNKHQFNMHASTFSCHHLDTAICAHCSGWRAKKWIITKNDIRQRYCNTFQILFSDVYGFVLFSFWCLHDFPFILTWGIMQFNTILVQLITCTTTPN